MRFFFLVAMLAMNLEIVGPRISTVTALNYEVRISTKTVRLYKYEKGKWFYADVEAKP